MNSHLSIMESKLANQYILWALIDSNLVDIELNLLKNIPDEIADCKKYARHGPC